MSRGFSFVYMVEQDGATKAKEAMNGKEICGRVVRVDYSLTNKPHNPTPGQYMGQKKSWGRPETAGAPATGGEGDREKERERGAERNRSRSPQRD